MHFDTKYPRLCNDNEGVLSASDNEPIAHFRPTEGGSSRKDILKMFISIGHEELHRDPFFQRLANCLLNILQPNDNGGSKDETEEVGLN